MPKINENFLKLEKNYLFINIAKKINAYISENPDKKDSNDDEDDILSEQKDEMEEGNNDLLNINKVDSIKVL